MRPICRLLEKYIKQGHEKRGMRKRGVIFHSKRGLSPLIATVLLIAFAVAMGAMIMNWSTSLGDTAGAPDCSGINLIINPTICYADSKLKIGLQNEGVVIQELKLKIVDDAAENEINLKNSRLRRGDVFNIDVPYLKSGEAYVSVTPSINFNEQIVPCDSPAIEISSLQACSS